MKQTNTKSSVWLALSFVAVFSLAVAGTATAQGLGPDDTVDSNSQYDPNDTVDSSSSGNSFYLQNPLDPKFKSVGDLIDGFMGVFAYLVVLAAVLMIIYVGLRFVLAQGNTEELKKRKDQLLWIVVGLAVVIGARVIVSVVINTLKATGTVDPTVIESTENALNR